MAMIRIFLIIGLEGFIFGSLIFKMKKYNMFDFMSILLMLFLFARAYKIMQSIPQLAHNYPFRALSAVNYILILVVSTMGGLAMGIALHLGEAPVSNILIAFASTFLITFFFSWKMFSPSLGRNKFRG